MRWLKHLSDAHNDEKLAMLRADTGFEGYGFYWFILEILAKHIDDSAGKTSVTYPTKFWCQLAGSLPSRFQRLANSCATHGLLSVKVDGNTLTIDCPNLLKYRDEWTRKKSKNSGATPETLRTKDTDTDTEVEEDKIKAPPIPPTGAPPIEPTASPLTGLRSASDPISPAERQNLSMADPEGSFRNLSLFDEFFAAYPSKIGRRQAWRAWQAIPAECQGLTPQRIIAAIKAQTANGHHFDGLDGTPAIPYPAKWLEHGRWDDEVKPPSQTVGHRSMNLDDMLAEARRKDEQEKAGRSQ